MPEEKNDYLDTPAERTFSAALASTRAFQCHEAGGLVAQGTIVNEHKVQIIKPGCLQQVIHSGECGFVAMLFVLDLRSCVVCDGSDSDPGARIGSTC